MKLAVVEQERIVKLESALRIIVTLSSFSRNEREDTRGRILLAIKQEAEDALR